MAFYKSISDLYDFIFPLSPAQIGFVTDSLTGADKKTILDVGCGTGNLSIELSTYFKLVHGIDPDISMLNIAREKIKGKKSNIRFDSLGMLDVESHYRNLDAILCFGNTLVHLSSEDEIMNFFKQSKRALKPGGKLLVQIINYDRILDQDISGLPTIENDKIRFERNYNYLSKENVIAFETILSIKESGEKIHNLIHLYPIRRSRLDASLQEAGFQEITYYGNFKKDTPASNSIPLVFEACV